MNPLEEQKGLVEFLEAALNEARGQSPLDPQQIQRLEAELDAARSDLSRLSSGVSRSDSPESKPPERDAASTVPFKVATTLQPWYRTFFSNLASVFLREEKHYDITAQPVEANLMVEDHAWLSVFWSNLKSFFRQEKKDYRITAQPVATHLLVEEIPWYRAIFSGIKGIFVKEELPEIEVTAQPVEVQEIFRDYRIRSSSFVLSVVVQCLFVAAIIFVPLLLIKDAPLTANETEIYFMSRTRLIAPKLGPSGGGGGGGLKAPKPPSKGRLPKPSNKQLTPPVPRIRNPRPLLPVEPTVIVPQLAQLPAINLPDYGDPLGIPGPPSPGQGSGGGIGTGTGTGVGSGEGAGVGPGKGGGIGGGVFRVGGGVTPPTVLSRIEPVYSEEARKAKYQGVVVLSAIVRKDGTIEILKVVRSLGLGLDENAIRALKSWRFRPGMRGGKPVDVALNIEVNFSLR